MMAVDLVEEAGFEALVATNAARAVLILEKRFDVCVLFTDVDIPPGLDGVWLATHVRDRWPPIEIIVTSGYHRASELVLPRHSAFFPKPYRHADIASALRRMAA